MGYALKGGQKQLGEDRGGLHKKVQDGERATHPGEGSISDGVVETEERGIIEAVRGTGSAVETAAIGDR